MSDDLAVAWAGDAPGPLPAPFEGGYVVGHVAFPSFRAMTAPVRVFVNGRGVDAPAGGTALDAVRAFDAALAEQVTAGERSLTDSRGLPVAADSPIFAGAIYRVVPVRKRSAADAPE